MVKGVERLLCSMRRKLKNTASDFSFFWQKRARERLHHVSLFPQTGPPLAGTGQDTLYIEFADGFGVVIDL
jgi:hypothetical protein